MRECGGNELQLDIRAQDHTSQMEKDFISVRHDTLVSRWSHVIIGVW